MQTRLLLRPKRFDPMKMILDGISLVHWTLVTALVCLAKHSSLLLVSSLERGETAEEVK